MKDYTDVAALSTVVLEESYVLDLVEEEGHSIRFRLHAVLTQDHPDYQPPGPGEQYCMAYGWLIFDNVVEVHGLQQFAALPPAVDATGEEDKGNIDSLKRHEDYWKVGGSWGEILIRTNSDPHLTLDDDESASATA